MEQIDWGLVIQWLGYGLVVGAAVAYLAAQNRRANHEELENLANTRGETIDDLREHVADLEDRVLGLESEIVAIRKQQTDIIIEGVNHGIRELVIELRKT